MLYSLPSNISDKLKQIQVLIDSSKIVDGDIHNPSDWDDDFRAACNQYKNEFPYLFYDFKLFDKRICIISEKIINSQFVYYVKCFNYCPATCTKSFKHDYNDTYLSERFYHLDRAIDLFFHSVKDILLDECKDLLELF